MSKIEKIRKFLIFLITALAVVVLCLLTLNQTLEYYYKSQFLMTPCDLCGKLNQNQSKCIDNCFITKTLYGSGGKVVYNGNGDLYTLDINLSDLP